MQRVVSNFFSTSQVKTVLVIAAYKEFENLKNLLIELDERLPLNVAVVVADDTGTEYENRIEKIVNESLRNSRNWLITFENSKSGRGAAVLRGFQLATINFPNTEFFAECDADGSHRPEDISRLILCEPSDFLIGSRYLRESAIEGWPLSRRIASRILNHLIPKVLGIKCTDVTNGLRRYSKKANEMVSQQVQINSGFIFLSEQAMILARNGVAPKEIPITFVNRIYGESSVGISEVVDSLFGVLSLIKSKKRISK